MKQFPAFVVFILLLALLTACPTPPVVDPCDANPSLPECQPLPCEPDCTPAEIKYTTTLKPSKGVTDPASYKQGEVMNGDLTITLQDPDKTINRGVVFLSLVECVKTATSLCPGEEKDIRQFNYIFDANNSSIEPDIFKKVYSGAELRKGLSSSFKGKINSSAPPGLYVLVVQVFNGENTDPNRVNDKDLIGKRQFYFFKVTP